MAYAFVLGVIIYKEIRLKDLGQIFIDTARETAAIGIIICAANFFGWLLLRTGLTIKVTAGITQMTSNPIVLLILLNIFLLVIGCFMETVVAILILTPMLMPVIAKVGIDPLHFGLVMVLNLMIGLLTPPFGVVLFVMAGISALALRAGRPGHRALPCPASCGPGADHLLPAPRHLAADSCHGQVRSDVT